METELDKIKKYSRTVSLADCDSLDNHSIINSGIRVRADIHAGEWWCNSCEGTTEGSQLVQPSCGYCQIA